MSKATKKASRSRQAPEARGRATRKRDVPTVARPVGHPVSTEPTRTAWLPKVRLLASELAQVRAAAADAGVDVSAYVRAALGLG